MIPSFLFSLFLSFATGFFLVRILLSLRGGDEFSLFFQLITGSGLGIGISSCVYFLCMLTSTTGIVLLIDTLFVISLFFFLLKRSSFPPHQGAKTVRQGDTDTDPRRNLEIPRQESASNNSILSKMPSCLKEDRTLVEKLLLVLFSIELLAFCGAFFFAFLKEPHGRWDAWLIWNMHARFLARSGEAWQTVFSLPMDWSHWDYPLMLPLAIVRSWKYAGTESILIPAAFAFIFTLLTAGLLLVSVSRLKNLTSGLAASMLLIATPFFILMGISQFADVPFSFFLLASIVFLSLPENHEKNLGPLILSGLFAGLCAWTKNEGILFFLVAGFVLFGTTVFHGGWRQAAGKSAWFFAGALPVLLLVIHFKLRLAPPNDLATGFAAGTAALAKITDPNRYATILKNFFITGFNFTRGPVDLRAGQGLRPGAVSILLPVAWLWLMGRRRDRGKQPGILRGSAILILMLLGYFAVYLLTPLPLNYHLATSLNRLYLQLWPSVIFLFFMAADAPTGDWVWGRKKLVDRGGSPAPSRKKGRKKR